MLPLQFAQHKVGKRPIIDTVFCFSVNCSMCIIKSTSVALMHKFADISIYRYFPPTTADTNSDSDILIILDDNNVLMRTAHGPFVSHTFVVFVVS